MIALMMERAGLDPTAVIGGRLSALGGSARLGRGELMVAEADESDRSFLKLFPTVAVITNLDHEHLESYRGFDDLQQAFVDFANRVPFYGGVVACADDPRLCEVLPRMTRRVTTYGLSSGVHLQATDLTLGPFRAEATVIRRSDDVSTPLGRLRLQVPGRHNVLNALAAVAVGLELGLPFDRIAVGLRDFKGADRRFDVRGEPQGVLIVDDYGHHPTEIAAVLDAARALNRRIIVAFQPHRYTRTARLLGEFGRSLSGAAHLILTDIYPAGEMPIPEATLDALAQAIRQSLDAPVDVVPRLDDVPAALARIARRGDVVITLGAGSISGVPDRLVRLLSANEGGADSLAVEGGRS
jgi:UDP-N-acetylmuramate--alanine ligase